MKNNIVIISTLLVLCVIFNACKMETVGQQPVESTPPGAVSDVSVKNIPGGAVLRFNLPDDEDLLYVKARYELKGGEVETVTSAYADSMVLEGFGDMEEHQIRLYAVDRSRNESAATHVTIMPLTPNVMDIGSSIDIQKAPGGMTITWSNPNKQDVAVNIWYKNQNGEYMPLETFYSSARDGNASIRGLEPEVPLDIMAYVEDKWKNTSEQKTLQVVPVYEVMLDKSKFKEANQNGDGPFMGRPLSYVWDGDTGDDGRAFSTAGGSGIWPQTVTLDMGQVSKISRLVVYQRGANSRAYIWWEGNLRKFDVFGRKTIDGNAGDLSTWTLLKACESIKPSGMGQGEYSEDDLFVALNGEEFTFDEDVPEVQYIRIRVRETWANGDNFQIQEFDIFGDDRF